MLLLIAPLQSDWNVATYNGVYKRYSNGDGTLMYAQASGPVPTLRLLNIRDGIQDAALLQLLPNATARAELVRKLVRSPTDRTENATLLAAVREQAAELAVV